MTITHISTFLILVMLSTLIKAQTDKVEDGYTKFYYPNGQISSEGFMKEGKPDGYWITYYVSGVINQKVTEKILGWIVHGTSITTLEILLRRSIIKMVLEAGITLDMLTEKTTL